MQVPAGDRDTQITFQSATTTQDATYRTDSKAWANLATNPTEWAQVQDMLPSRGENIAEGIDVTRKPCRVRTLYRSDITAQMRVVIASVVHEIISGPVVLGSPARPEGLELICAKLSSQGETP